MDDLFVMPQDLRAAAMLIVEQDGKRRLCIDIVETVGQFWFKVLADTYDCHAVDIQSAVTVSRHIESGVQVLLQACIHIVPESERAILASAAR